MSKLKEATAISSSTRLKVFERDNGNCVMCGKPSHHCHHFIPRSRLGMGVEQNLVMLCTNCHYRIHNPKSEEEKIKLNAHLRKRLMMFYPDWKEEDLIYKKV